MKPFWEISAAEAQKCLDATTWHPSITEYFPGGGWSTRYLTRGGMPVTMCRLNLVKGLGPALQIAEGETVELPEKVQTRSGSTDQPDMADHLVCAARHREGRVPRCLYGDEQLGRQPRRHRVTAIIGADLITPRRDAAHSGLYAQRAGGSHLPAQRVERLWHRRPRRRGFSRVRRISAHFTNNSVFCVPSTSRNVNRAGDGTAVAHPPQQTDTEFENRS